FSAYYNYDYDYISVHKNISQNYNLLENIIGKNRSVFGINSKANYYLNFISSNLKAKFNYTKANFKNRVNNSNKRTVISNNYTYGLSLKTAFEGFFNLTFGMEWQTNTVKTTRKNSSIRNSTYLNLPLVFNSRFNLNLSLTRYYLKQISKNNDYYFMD